MLLTYWEEVDSFAPKNISRPLSRGAGSTVIARIKHEETLTQLVSASGFLNQRLLEAGIDPKSIPPETQSTLLKLTRGYRERLRDVIAVESD